jgi:UDP-GlcNAc3NAcA epimerase
MYDAALYYSERADNNSKILEHLGLQPGNYILATIHRAENTDDHVRLKAIFDGFREVGKRIRIIIPLHPRTRKTLNKIAVHENDVKNITIIDPVGYLDMVMLEKNARLIATDSGGVQKEAFFYRVPCVTLRDETEWVELVELGWNKVVPPSGSREIAETIINSLDMAGKEGKPYGDGRSAEKIIEVLSGFEY